MMNRQHTFFMAFAAVCLLSSVSWAGYYAGAHAYYLVNGDYGNTSTHGADIPGVTAGQELDVTRPTNNTYTARAVLDTGTMQSYFSINNFEGSNFTADASVQTSLEDNLLVAGGTLGDTVNVIFTVALSGTLTVEPQNGLSEHQYGSASLGLSIYGGCVDYKYPSWAYKSLYMSYQDNAYTVDVDGFTEGVDYTLSGGVLTMDTQLQIAAELTVGEWQNVIFDMSLGGDVSDTNLDATRQCRVEGDFWNTMLVDIALAPEYADTYTLTRESGVPEPATLTLLLLGAAIIRKHKK